LFIEDDKRGVIGTAAARVRPSRAGDRGTRQLGGNTGPAAAGPDAALSARRTRHAGGALPYRSRRRHRRLTNDDR